MRAPIQRQGDILQLVSDVWLPIFNVKGWSHSHHIGYSVGARVQPIVARNLLTLDNSQGDCVPYGHKVRVARGCVPMRAAPQQVL